MTIRSMGVSLVAAVLTMGTILPASAQVTAVPREGVAFNDTVTQRVKIETVDPDDRTVTIYRLDAEPELVNVKQELVGDPQLPGFRVAVAEIFA